MSTPENKKLERAYHVQAVLGSGGFGAVYRAKYVGEGNFSKIVALKVLHSDMAAVGEVAMRMRDEARMLGLLRHRNIVQVDRSSASRSRTLSRCSSTRSSSNSRVRAERPRVER